MLKQVVASTSRTRMKFPFALLTILAVSANAFDMRDVDMEELDRLDRELKENQPGSLIVATKKT